MKYICPNCGSTYIERHIIGAEIETVCQHCGYYDTSDHFIPKSKKEKK